MTEGQCFSNSSLPRELYLLSAKESNPSWGQPKALAIAPMKPLETSNPCRVRLRGFPRPLYVLLLREVGGGALPGASIPQRPRANIHVRQPHPHSPSRTTGSGPQESGERSCTPCTWAGSITRVWGGESQGFILALPQTGRVGSCFYTCETELMPPSSRLPGG